MTEHKPRYVFDTNTLVSAVLFEQSKPSQAFRKALRIGAVLTSPDALDELLDVLERDKFNRYVTREDREAFYAALVERAEVVEPKETIQECRDANDNKFLELAVEGGATAIVSGDNDLLVMNLFQNIPIITPAAFLDLPSET